MKIVGETLSDTCNSAIDYVLKNGEKVDRRLGYWAMQKSGIQEMTEVRGLILEIADPRKRWCSRVNSGMLTEVLDYFMGLNPGFTHLSSWKFYDSWINVNMEKFPYTYGERIFGNGTTEIINQWQTVVNMLRMDPTTRHAYITITRPIDRLNEFIPCNSTFHFQLSSEGKLDMITTCRSQDSLRGLFLDCFAYTNFLEQMSLETEIPMGKYVTFEENIHIYERDLDNVESMKSRSPYEEDIEVSNSALLTRELKRKLYHISNDMYKKYEVIYPRISKIPIYWSSWMIFEYIEEIKRKVEADDKIKLDSMCSDIRWSLEERIKQLKKEGKW